MVFFLPFQCSNALLIPPFIVHFFMLFELLIGHHFSCEKLAVFFTCATMKTKMGRAADLSACSMQLSSRLYWLLCGAKGGLDNPENHRKEIIHFQSRFFFSKAWVVINVLLTLCYLFRSIFHLKNVLRFSIKKYSLNWHKTLSSLIEHMKF